MAERIDHARVLELLFDDGLDLSDCDSDEDDEDQVSSYLGDELLDLEELAALSRAVSSTQDIGRSVGDGAFVTPDEENEYGENGLLENIKKKDIISNLRAAGYRSDPIKAWKATVKSSSAEEEQEGSEDEVEEAGVKADDYNYLLSMTMWSLTKEKKEELLKDRDDKVDELRILKEKTTKNLWMEDLDQFMKELDRVEEDEKLEQHAGAKISIKKSIKGKGSGKGRQTKLTGSGRINNLKDTKPSEFGEPIVHTVPEFNANPKKAGEKRPRKLPKGQTTLKLAGEKKESMEEGEEQEDGAMDVESTVTAKAKKPPSKALEIFSDDSGADGEAGLEDGGGADGDGDGDEDVVKLDKPLPPKDPIVKPKPTKTVVKQKKAPRKQATLKFSPKKRPSVDSSGDEEVYVPLSKRIALGPKTAKAKKLPAKKAKTYIDDSDGSDWGANKITTPTKKQNGGGGVNVKPRKRPLVLEDSIDVEEEKVPFAQKTTKPVPKKLCVSSDDDDDEWIGGGEIEDVDSPSPVQVSSRPRRQAKKAIYIVDDSDED